MFRKILIANRGEIAVRIIRALREMGILSVAVYSEADRDALHTQLADESICIGPAESAGSYLNMENIISAAVITKAEAIHPGFGFLSETAEFAELCEKCGITFIGPPAKVIADMGNKAVSRQTMIDAGLPVIPGCQDIFDDAQEAMEAARRVGYPVMIKAVLGGGGKGMRVARGDEDFENAFLTARKEAVASFGSGAMYVEHFIERPKHIEFQILADSHGNVVHLGDRDCSVQRNNQKMIEQSPSTALSSELRRKMGEVATSAAKASGYVSAGTVEFLLDRSGNFYFMEMNTRIQVEHPVTEMVTGIDLIKEQIRIAAGEKLTVTQKDVEIKGCAIECRINAEIPSKNFRPCPGKITDLYLPGGNGVRVDSAIFRGYTVPPYYDSMLLKLIVHSDTRKEAIAKMKCALGEVVIEGIETNTDFLYDIITDPVFEGGDIDIEYIKRKLNPA